MRVNVDPSRCQGHGLCVMYAQELFDLDDEGRARVLEDVVPDGLHTAAREAEEGCPEQAITVHAQLDAVSGPGVGHE